MANKAFARGLLIALFFGIVFFAVIPVYVQRPSFIPGFAPPPDMWPRTVSLLGLALGLLAMVSAVLGTRQARREASSSGPAGWFSQHRGGFGRLALALTAFAGFVILTPRLGFLASSMLLALACFVLAGASKRLVTILLLAVLLPLGLQFFFGHVTHTPFPMGSWGVMPTLP
ncbi:tripartite tricarboxylate transporter TctB family protein [Nitratireductor sp. ZSWI3]|uniref:tripartite tricarboxylate transporter TctB family protein n=1 Tax=Nitratireductor sp. ZSWI3 TaxID=2966359 RepID=UPI00214FF5F6|nr:tripartite tricarboxylate transporter TctB family protein [Nitratireductor sp. ZSWI3]MCR4265397.1 tripartite tricarboxylate transporter TctB family protein [Nitratireductor sp. ZSWI3]